MPDRGIIFSAPMVRALLAGAKTQTRRLITPRNQAARLLFFEGWTDEYILGDGNAEWRQAAHGYAVGDRLYVREAHWIREWESFGRTDRQVIYRATDEEAAKQRFKPEALKWRPSIHMPRWASRLTLQVTDVRVQRLQMISEADAIAEGIEPGFMGWRDYRTDRGGDPARASTSSPIASYRSLWGELHAKDGQRWSDNPWIVALTFEVGRHNIGAGAVQ